MIGEQEFGAGLEELGEQKRQKEREILFLREGMASVGCEKERLQAELRRLGEQQEEIKETVRIERERNRREERQR